MLRLKSTIAVGVMLAFSAGAALADGMPRPAMKTAPVLPSWSGFYVGGGLGYGAWTADTTTASPVTGICVLCVAQTQGGDGIFGTVTVGYDQKLSSTLVGGVFFDASFGDIKGTIQDQGPFFAARVSQDRMFAVGARLGMLLNPAVLAYGTLGYTNAHFAGGSMVFTFPGAGATGFSASDVTLDGWFIGSGIETMLHPGWYWRSEYRYADYNTGSFTDINRTTGARFNNITFDPIEQTFRSSLIYKFN